MSDGSIEQAASGVVMGSSTMGKDRFSVFGQKYAVWCVLCLGFVIIPVLYFTGLMSIEMVNKLGQFLALALVAIGLDLIWGYTGILSLCQAFFFALGGYAMGMYLAHNGPLDGDSIPRALYVVSSSVDGVTLPWFWVPFKSFPITLLLGLLIPGLVAGVIGYFGFVSRVRGVYFAILTQAITLAAWLVFCDNNMRLCGTNGLTNFVKIAGFDLTKQSTKLGLYFISLISVIAAYRMCRGIVNSRLGRILVAIRDNENTLRFSGYKPYAFKLFVFVVAAMLAGWGGMLYAPQKGIFTPSHMTVVNSIMVVVWVAFGGRGTLSGAILGALSVNLLYDSLTTWAPDYWPFVQGGLFLLVVLYFSDGLMGIWRKWVTPVEEKAGVALNEPKSSNASEGSVKGEL